MANERPVYVPIPPDEWRKETARLNSDEKRVFLRRTRQGESDALNHASKAEIEEAAFSGMPIAHVMIKHRQNRQEIGGKGWNAFQRACKAQGVDPNAKAGGSQPAAEPAAEPAQPAGPAEANAKRVAEAVKAEVEKAVAEQDALSEAKIKGLAEIVDEQGDKIADLKGKMNQPIEITIPERPEPVVIEGAHEAFQDCLRVASVHQRLLMHGPKGSGKSTIVHAIAKALGYENNYAIVSCTAETSVNVLIGTRSLRTDEFMPGPVLTTYENGGLLFLDEFDALDPTTGVGLNAYLDGGVTAPVDMRTGNMLAKRGRGFLPIIAVNTLAGPTRDYQGRMKQDGATLSRFPALVRRFIDYSRQIEGKILGHVPELADRLWTLRDKVREYNLDDSRMITTRDFASAAREVAYRGSNPRDAMTDDAIIAGTVADWTREEKRKVGCC